MKTKTNLICMLAILMATLFSVSFVSCGDDEDEVSGIVGTWYDSYTTMTFSADGKYSSTTKSTATITSYRNGTYFYNASTGSLVLNISASNENTAYTQSLIVQTLTKTNLVLLYTDGDVKGSYTRRN